MSELEGQVALVTGAAGGIGRAVVTALARRGAGVAAVDLDADGVREVASLAEDLGRKGVAIAADIGSVAEIERTVAETLAALGRIDILVNNAGTGTRERLFDVTEEAWDRVHAVNLRAPFFYMQAVGRHMVERGGGGRIISVSSASGFRAVFTHPVYSSSKAGIDALTRSMASALGEHGINVNAVAPGLTATRMGAVIGDEAAQQEAVESRPLANLLQRVSQPEDVAEVIAFLCLPESRQITGQTIHTSAGNVV
jgi:NAD(P)-dependent dehydrogenase (short-subunit alcohol dehydrogenase family)